MRKTKLLSAHIFFDYQSLTKKLKSFFFFYISPPRPSYSLSDSFAQRGIFSKNFVPCVVWKSIHRFSSHRFSSIILQLDCLILSSRFLSLMSSKSKNNLRISLSIPYTIVELQAIIAHLK